MHTDLSCWRNCLLSLRPWRHFQITLSRLRQLSDNQPLRLILTVRDAAVYFVYQSAREFLLEQASDQLFPHGVKRGTSQDFLAVAPGNEIMRQTLRRNIYSLGAPGFPVDQVQKPEPDPLAAAWYSCLHWVDHLYDCYTSQNTTTDCGNNFKDRGLVEDFIKENYLQRVSVFPRVPQKECIPC